MLQGLLSIGFSLWRREPIRIVWSTPGSALMIATGLPAGGYPAAVGAFLFAAALIVVAGVWSPFGRLVGAIPRSLASAMLAGILFGLCLAPVKAMTERAGPGGPDRRSPGRWPGASPGPTRCRSRCSSRPRSWSS